MKKIIVLFVLMLSAQIAVSQELYSKAYGNQKNTPLLFLHGGPGYNAAGFEVTTAQLLANHGFYVIVYDRRGEGRSGAVKAQFNFEETFSDINAVMAKYGVKKVNLIGHSFGGIVAALYAEKFPGNVSSIELVSAPVALQETFRTILASSRKIYTDKKDATNLSYIDMIEKMDPTSVEYYAYSFGHAMQNGFYSPKKMTDEAKAVYAAAAKEPDFKYASQMTSEPPQGFLKNEHYTSIDLTKNLNALVAKKVRIYGLYGKDDGLYSVAQVEQLTQIIGKNNLEYWDDCSHNVFIDQQKQFLEFFDTHLKQ